MNDRVAHSVKTKRGASATVENDTIVVRDRDGVELIAYSEDAGLRITAPHGDLTLSAPRGRVVIEGAEAAVRVGRWELEAHRIVETAADVFRNVKGLAQTRAGRLRRIVTGSYELFADRAAISSEQDTSIDGRRVLLG